MSVIALRNKKQGIFHVIGGAIILAISIVLSKLEIGEIEVWENILLFAVSIALILYGIVFLIRPKNAIVTDGENICVNNLFSLKTIKIEAILSVECEDIATVLHNELNFRYRYRVKHDIRTINVTYIENGCTKQVRAVEILQATATAMAIKEFVEQVKGKKINSLWLI